MPGVSHSRALVCLHGSRDGVGLPKGDEARTGAKRRGILPIWRISADSMEPAVPLSLPLSLPLLLISSARLVFLSYAPPICVAFSLFPSIVPLRSSYQSQRRMSISRLVCNDHDSVTSSCVTSLRPCWYECFQTAFARFPELFRGLFLG